MVQKNHSQFDFNSKRTHNHDFEKFRLVDFRSDRNSLIRCVPRGARGACRAAAEARPATGPTRRRSGEHGPACQFRHEHSDSRTHDGLDRQQPRETRADAIERGWSA